MVRASYDQKPYRRTHDGDLRRHRAPEPVRRDQRGRGDPGRATRTRPAASASRSARRSRSPRGSADTRYALGSVLNHVLMHQTVIGEEALKQFAAAGETGPT